MALLPEEGVMPGFFLDVCIACDLTGIIEGPGLALVPAQGPQVGHFPLCVEEGMNNSVSGHP